MTVPMRAGTVSRAAAIVACCAACALCASVAFISGSDVKKMREAGKALELVDVRGPEEFAASRLTGALNVPFDRLAQAALPHDRLLIVYCSSKYCSLSQRAAEVLVSRGYSNVKILEGGIEGGVAKGLVAEGSGGPAPARTFVSAAALDDWLKQSEGPVVIDLRSPVEFSAGHLPGAKNVPLEKLEAEKKRLPSGRSFVVYDRTGSRAMQGAQILRQMGKTAYELEGGISLWSRRGPIVTDDRRANSAGPTSH